MTSRTKIAEKAIVAIIKGSRIIAEAIVIQVSDTRLLLFIFSLPSFGFTQLVKFASNLVGFLSELNVVIFSVQPYQIDNMGHSS
jgi:hypothetical protein